MSLKNKILQHLELNADSYISGQELAEKFGVSRNAVWKTINQIKNDGYIIESVRNKGYCLSAQSDVLSINKIQSLLSENAQNIKLFVYESLDSTNNEAKRMISNGFKDTALIIANEQTGGRGRLGRSFYSPKNTGIYMSFIIHPQLNIADAVSVTTAASVAVVKAIENLTDIKPLIKWVNDVYIGEKKACGILTEAVTDFETGCAQSVIIGIGINTTTESFPTEIADRAGSVNFGGLTRNELIAAVANEMTEICANLSDKSYIKDYRRHSLIIGKEIDFYINNEKQTASAVDIDDDGGLVVRLQSGEIKTLHSGEVTVRLAESN